jgi:hypothetical protein
MTIGKQQYKDKRTCLRLHTTENGYSEPLLTATINIPEADVELIAKPYKVDPARIVFIKNWSENKGIYEALLSAGYISPSLYLMQTGFVSAQICIITEEAWKKLKK